jgi:hypothetical protein
MLAASMRPGGSAGPLAVELPEPPDPSYESDSIRITVLDEEIKKNPPQEAPAVLEALKGMLEEVRGGAPPSKVAMKFNLPSAVLEKWVQWCWAGAMTNLRTAVARACRIQEQERRHARYEKEIREAAKNLPQGAPQALAFRTFLSGLNDEARRLGIREIASYIEQIENFVKEARGTDGLEELQSKYEMFEFEEREEWLRSQVFDAPFWGPMFEAFEPRHIVNAIEHVYKAFCLSKRDPYTESFFKDLSAERKEAFLACLESNLLEEDFIAAVSGSFVPNGIRSRSHGPSP